MGSVQNPPLLAGRVRSRSAADNERAPHKDMLRQHLSMDIRMEFQMASGTEPESVVMWFGNRQVAVRSISDRWYGTGQTWWKLDTDDGPYVLRPDDSRRVWALVAVPRSHDFSR